MTSRRILELLPCPENVTETDDHDWHRIENNLGVTLPATYKDFLATYGTGSISSYLWILNPFSHNANLGLNRIQYFQKSYTVMKEEFPEDFKRPPLPQKHSFITWAVTDDGDSLIWSVDGSDSEVWEVVIHNKDQGIEEHTGMQTDAFLETMLNGNLVSDLIPGYFLFSEKIFKPL